MEKIKITWLICVILLFGMLCFLIKERIYPTGHFLIIDEPKGDWYIDPKCQDIRVVFDEKINDPYLLKGKTFYINPTLSSNLSMPKRDFNNFNLTSLPLNYYYNSSRRDIVILGDSFSTAVGILQNETYPYILNLIGDYNIINLGIGGLNSKQEVQRFKEVGLQYNPNVVILQFYENDWEDTLGIWSFIWNVSLYLNERGYYCLETPLNSKNKFFTQLYRSNFEYIQTKSIDTYIKENIESPLQQLNDLSIKYNFTIYFLYLPSTKEFVKKIKTKIIEEYHWNIIDIEQEMDFPGWKPPFTISQFDVHFSKQTHKKVAEIINLKLKH